MKETINQRIERRVTKTVQIDDQDIRNFLSAKGIVVPPDADVFVRVPGGGDYSNTNLEVTGGTPVQVTWQTTEVEDV